MKKYLLIFGVLLSLLLAGCDKPTTTETKVNTKTETETKEVKEETSTADIDFYEITEIDSEKIIGEYKDQIVKDIGYSGENAWGLASSLFRWYEVGKINKDPYNGQKLLILELQCDGMCFKNNIYRFAWDKEKNELSLLEKHSDEDYTPEYFDLFLSKTDSSTELKDLNLPKEITLPDGKNVITMETKDSHYTFHSIQESIEIAFEDKKYGKVYKSNQVVGEGCLYVQSHDGSISRYAYNPQFFDAGEITIKWDDGSKSTNLTDAYTHVHRGCGIAGKCYFIEDITKQELKKVGTTSANIDLYELAKPLEGAEENKNTTAAQKQFDTTYSLYKSFRLAMEEINGKEVPAKNIKKSFEEFTNSKPLLYWQDPLGRWSQIIAQEFQPPAECGKPVIYLYPEETTDVHVEVDIDEFTVTIPDYGQNGWTVKAEPNGEIYNYADKQNYPYLFWEGKKKGGIAANKGFVIARNEIKTFLNKSLDKMGLNKQEKSDFMEFWYPRMMENNEPYFFISFLGTIDFNKVAPLSITPEPDTLIRVFMYYDPIYTSFTPEKQELKTVPRKGFTVLEWGGTSSAPWQY